MIVKTDIYDRSNPSLQVLFCISLKPQLNPSFIQSQSLETHLTSLGLLKKLRNVETKIHINETQLIKNKRIINTENKTKSQKEINQQSHQQKNSKKP